MEVVKSECPGCKTPMDISYGRSEPWGYADLQGEYDRNCPTCKAPLRVVIQEGADIWNGMVSIYGVFLEKR